MVLTFTIRFLFFILLALVAVNLYVLMGIALPDKTQISSMATIFLSIVLEALPFILIGSLAASLIQIFISEEWIARVIPKNRLLGLLSAGLLGLIIPVCECAIIPITRGLMKKGVPAGIAVTFMLAAPIINPVVLVSTYYAFGGTLPMVLFRAGAGLAASLIIGFIIDIVYGKINPVKAAPIHIHNHGHHHECHESCCSHHQEKEHTSLIEIIEHTTEEFYDVGKFLILGALISTILQSAIPRQYMMNAGNSGLLSIAVMMSFAYTVSLCSEADAFVANTFTGQFAVGSIIAFLILGPMIDIKNTLMLKSSFKKGFSALLVVLIFIVCFVVSAIAGVIARGVGI
jgi:uncharacterized membrane protein YraQ (UPF0718 family)